MANMKHPSDQIRVLYSFPHKIGAARICYTAWQQVNGLIAAGVDVLAMPAVVARPIPTRTVPTLAKGNLRIPFKLLGKYRAFRMHDQIVARRLEKLAGKIDLVHVWPYGALETIKTAKRLGIPTVLERPNAHTRYALDTVRAECQRIGVELPPGDDYVYRTDVLGREEEEFALADYLLCASDFSAKTFQDAGYPPEKIIRHTYGYDEDAHSPDTRTPREGFTAIFVGVAAVRKGLHLGLESWMKSPAARDGVFMIAGQIAPDYQKYLQQSLSHPSVKALGHRHDVPQLMRKADVLVLPSLEEGFGLVCAEAIGGGCVPLVSEACTDICKHMHNALVHPIGDVPTLTHHLTMLYEDRALLQRLREACIQERLQFTWTAAGKVLLNAYREGLERQKRLHPAPANA
jgi:glycosyltransferase involved in cell wall biosynthesis